ncbi:dentin sialophosphoprotein precursor [Scheffersomyces xylosifermentans]|uniref:dentin sialophosphoprotein precursor n=1 Tax=Scheffersomyces xylosifermentans TaxID=1304137 RepID=UPI00315DF67D
MSDKFGRHKSNRWVKASVPTYGDDWGSEYDYEDDSDQEPDIPSRKVTPQRFELPETTETSSPSRIDPPSLPNLSPQQQFLNHQSSPATTFQPSEHTKNLVLSIDNFDHAQLDSDLDSDDSGIPDIVDDTYFATLTLSMKKSGANSTNIDSNDPPVAHNVKLVKIQNKNQADDFFPPTPTYSTHTRQSSNTFSTPDTARSDRSFQSDTDSIQKEPENLNLADAFTSKQRNLLEENVGQSGLARDNTINGMGSQGKENEPDLDRPISFDPKANKESESGVAPAPLVLSIDKKEFNYSDDSSDDDWGYNSQHSSNEDLANDKPTDSEKDSYSFEEKGLSVKPSNSPNLNKTTPIRTDALDSLISDLHSSLDKGSSDKEAFLPQLDSHDLEMPDFENTSFGQYDDEFSGPTTPIAPLSIDDEKKGHESFINDQNIRKKSIRKPPPLRKDLVSADYTNIADAVSGYINENDSDSTKNLSSINESPQEEPVKPFSPAAGVNDLKSPELQPVVSSGSLSTGSISIDPTPVEDNVNTVEGDEKDLNRRASTMSTATFNMGGWTPNTNGFRDQFISDNDNESHINFDPDDSASSNFNKFTKVRTVSGSTDVSNGSDQSIPETIDVPLPRITEDPDDGNEGNDTTPTDGQTLDYSPTNQTTDSIFKEHSYPRAVFKEEKLTPEGSKENLNKTPDTQRQRYSSLLGSSDDKRLASDASTLAVEKESLKSVLSPSSPESSRIEAISDTTDVASVSSVVKKPNSSGGSQKYPVSNWKAIMALSQPQDRIAALKDALRKEVEYDSGLQAWLSETLKSSQVSSNMHIGRLASEAYSNAQHSELRRHNTIRSKVSIVKDKVETSGLQASSFGKRFFSKGKKLMKSTTGES